MSIIILHWEFLQWNLLTIHRCGGAISPHPLRAKSQIQLLVLVLTTLPRCRQSEKQINTYKRDFKIHPSTARSKTATNANTVTATATSTPTTMCSGPGVTFERKKVLFQQNCMRKSLYLLSLFQFQFQCRYELPHYSQCRDSEKTLSHYAKKPI